MGNAIIDNINILFNIYRAYIYKPVHYLAFFSRFSPVFTCVLLVTKTQMKTQVKMQEKVKHEETSKTQVK